MNNIAGVTFSVSEFLDFTNELLKPLKVTIQGEVTSVTPRGKTIFFTVSDPDDPAKLECVIWQYRYNQLGFDLEEGAAIQLVGSPNIYKPMGKFSFVVDHINPIGEGALKKAFELLKKQLQQAGFFDPEKKQELPTFPQKIGLITSKNGDAIKDFRTHLGRHGYQIFHKDVRVEGLSAIDSIVEAIQWFNQQPQPVEVLVITRGGGSLESLQAFNSGAVAKAIFASKIPVVSAVGHENDVTIADLVADVRASTPTDAGKILSKNWHDAQTKLEFYRTSMIQSLRRVIDRYQNKSHQIWQQMVHIIEKKLSNQLETMNQLFGHSVVLYQHHIQMAHQRLESYHKQLTLSDPQLKLKQGYSMTFNHKGELIRTVSQLKKGEKITTKMYDGNVISEVI